MPTIRRLLAVVSILAALTWGCLFAMALRRPEGDAARRIRTAAFVVMIGAGSLYPVSRGEPAGSEEEETL